MSIKTGEEIKNMRHLLIATMTVTLTLPPMPAQKIETETASRERVVRVQTAMNHLTVIEVGEPVTTVAVGSPQSFKVERRENKVFIQPLVRTYPPTYLYGRLRLGSATSLCPQWAMPGKWISRSITASSNRKAQMTQPKPSEPAATVPAVPSEMLLNGTPVRLVGVAVAPKASLGVLILDVYRRQDEVFIPLFNRESFESHVSHRPAERGVFERPAIRSVAVDIPELAIGRKRRLSSESR